LKSLRVKKELFATITLLMLVAAACSPAADTAPTATPQQARVEEQAEAQVDEQQSPKVEPTETAAPEDEPVIIEPPSPRQGLSATDPTTVDLASGKPTLVEFFAFW
jgi:hypothetical protein